LVEDLKPFADLGFEEVILMPMSTDPVSELQGMAPAVERLAAL